MSYSRYTDHKGAPMLDAFIIEKIRREQQQESGVPLRIHVPRPEDDPRWREQQQQHQQQQQQDDRPDRGVVIIDYSI